MTTVAFTRQRLLQSAAAAGAGLMLGGVLTSLPAGAATGSAYWNVSDTYNLDSNWSSMIGSLETKLGRTFAGVRMNGGFTRTTDFAELHKDVMAGRTWVYVNGKPSAPSKTAWSTYWRDVAAGKYDSAFTSFFQAVKANGDYTTTRPLRYSFNHEQTSTSETGGVIAGTAAQYAAAWNHVMSLMRSMGCHVSQGGNMLSCWVPEWIQISRDPAYEVTKKKTTTKVLGLLASKILAGGLDTSMLDLVGADIYNFSGQTNSVADQWQPLHNLGVHIGKPVFTGETGFAGSDSYVVAYLKQLDATLKSWGAGSGPGEIHAICWTNRVTATGDDRMDATAARLAQYKAMANDPFYSAVQA